MAQIKNIANLVPSEFELDTSTARFKCVTKWILNKSVQYLIETVANLFAEVGP